MLHLKNARHPNYCNFQVPGSLHLILRVSSSGVKPNITCPQRSSHVLDKLERCIVAPHFCGTCTSALGAPIVFHWMPSAPTSPRGF